MSLEGRHHHVRRPWARPGRGVAARLNALALVGWLCSGGCASEDPGPGPDGGVPAPSPLVLEGGVAGVRGATGLARMTIADPTPLTATATGGLTAGAIGRRGAGLRSPVPVLLEVRFADGGVASLRGLIEGDELRVSARSDAPSCTFEGTLRFDIVRVGGVSERRVGRVEGSLTCQDGRRGAVGLQATSGPTRSYCGRVGGRQGTEDDQVSGVASVTVDEAGAAVATMTLFMGNIYEVGAVGARSGPALSLAGIWSWKLEGPARSMREYRVGALQLGLVEQGTEATGSVELRVRWRDGREPESEDSRSGPVRLSTERCQRVDPLTEPAISGVSLEPTFGATALVGGTLTLTARTLDGDGEPLPGRTYSWSSSDAAIATVTDGLVRGVSVGSTLIRVTDDAAGISAERTVRVVAIPPIVTALEIQDGNDQSTLVGARFQVPLTARVLGPNRAPLVGIPVTFTISNGAFAAGGNVIVVETDAQGRAAAAVVAGENPGPVPASARIDGLDLPTLTYDLEARALGTFSIFAGDQQSAFVGEPLPNRLVVLVQDNAGAAVPDVPVRFALGSGAGRLSVTMTRTDATGGAYTEWTLGPDAGPQVVTANTEPGYLPRGLTFRATAIEPTTGVSYLGVTAGDRHSCAVATGGVTYCWGDDDRGQLGVGGAPGGAAARPTLVQTNERHVQVFGGGDFTCALESASDIASCWGANDRGQFAFFNPMSSAVPVSPNPSLLVDGGMELGRAHGCALVFGRLQCWGDNAALQTSGLGMTHPIPVDVAAPMGFGAVTAFSAGGASSCAIYAARPEPRTFCWGQNEDGELGVSASAATELPQEVALSAAVPFTPERVAVGDAFACASGLIGTIARAPHVTCWGRNDRGQLGAAQRFGAVSLPAGPAAVLALGAGRAHACALLDDGQVVCWGDDAYGQLGRGAVGGSSAEARAVPGLWQALAVGGDHTCALAGRPGAGAAGEVWCWGRNDRGQLGTSDRMPRSAPTLVVEP